MDDTELWLTMHDKDITQLASEMQEIGQHWEQLLYTTIGALAVEKCLFVAMEWSFPNDKHILCQPSMMSTSISLTSGNNYQDSISIVQSCQSEGQCNLGAWLALDRNNAADLRALCSKGKSMSTNFTTFHLQHKEVNIAYKMMFCLAIKYSLSSTTISQSECKMVDKSYLPTLLSCMGINKCTKQLHLLGPPSLGELGFTDTWTDQS